MANASASVSEPVNSPRERTISVPHVRMRYSPSRVAITQGLTVARRPRRAGGMCDVSRLWEGRSGPLKLWRNDCAARGRLDPGNVGTNVPAVEAAVLERASAGAEVTAECVDESHVRHPVGTGGTGRIRRAVSADQHVPLEHAAGRKLRERPASHARVAPLHAILAGAEHVA